MQVHKVQYMYVHRVNHLEHLKQASRYPIPNPSITNLSLSSHVLPPASRSTTRPGLVRSRIPLESNFHPCAFLVYRRRSRSNVVSPVQPRTAQPTVRQGEMMMSTRRWGFGLWCLFPSGDPSSSFLGAIPASCAETRGSCQINNALSSVSKCFPESSLRNGSGCCSRFVFVMCSARV